MKVISLILFLLLPQLALAESVQAHIKKPDYLTRHADGRVKSRGVYETNESGTVTRFTVFDGSGELLYTEIPYYADDGRIIRADRFDADGKLEKVVVYFDHFAKIMNANGEVIETQGISPHSPTGANTRQED